MCALATLSDVEHSMVLMTIRRVQFIRNEVVHNNPPPLMEASKRFLMSYLDSLIGLKIDLITDRNKGKQIMTYDRALQVASHVIMPRVVAQRTLPCHGWVKLNSDGSFGHGSSAGAGMVLRQVDGTIVYLS